MQKKKQKLNIAEGAVLLGIVIFIICIMSANSSADVPISVIEQKMTEQEGLSDMFRQDAASVKSVYGIVPSEFMYYKTDAVMDVRELFIARASGADEMDAIESAAAEHISGQIDAFTGYGPDQVALLEHSVSMKKGDYFFLAVGDHAEQWQEAFIKLIG
ncbi:MAG: DUF4358 domain-containing protein [Parasporobacterium sp.]|nr:DUF4358 domain-containing protein [Parasporobacterium sp.]